MSEAEQIKKLQAADQEQIKIILDEIVVQVLKDDKLWQKIGHDLDLSDDELSRVWDHANETRN